MRSWESWGNLWGGVLLTGVKPEGGLRRPKRGLGSLGLHLLLCLKFKSYTLQKKLQTNEISLSGQKRPRGCLDVRVLGPWWWESDSGVWMLSIQPLRATAGDLPGLGVLGGKAWCSKLCPWSAAVWPSCGCLGFWHSVEDVWRPLCGLQPLLTSLLGPCCDRGSLLRGWDLATPDTRPACSRPLPRAPTFCAAISYPARERCCLRSWGPVTPQVGLLHDAWCPLFVSLCPPAGPALLERGEGKLSLHCPHGLAQKGPQCRPLSWSHVTAWLRCCCCSAAESCPTRCDPVDRCTPGSPVLRLSVSAHTHVH